MSARRWLGSWRGAVSLALLLGNAGLAAWVLAASSGPEPEERGDAGEGRWLSVERLPPVVARAAPPPVAPAQRARADAFQRHVNELLASPSPTALAEAAALFDSPSLLGFLQRLRAKGQRIELHIDELSGQVGETVLGDFMIVGSSAAATDAARGANAGANTEVNAEATFALPSSWLELTTAPGKLHPFFPDAQRDARTSKIAGEVRVDVLREWMTAELSMTIRSDERDGPNAFVFSAMPGWSNDERTESLTWEEVSQDGVPCPFVQTPDELVVWPPRPAAEVTLRLRYRGRPAITSRAYLARGQASFSGLTPELPNGQPAIDVTILYRDLVPSAQRMKNLAGHAAPSLLSGLVAEQTAPAAPPARGWPAPRLNGSSEKWKATRLRSEADDELGFLLAPFIFAGDVTADGFTASLYEVADPSELTGRDSIREHLAAPLEDALRRLAPLGPPPVNRAPIVAMERHGHLGGQLLNGLIVLEPALREHPNVLAHELAHLWFGMRVRREDDAISRWSEGVAEYVSNWGLDDKTASAEREERLADHDQLQRHIAMTSTGLHVREDSRRLSYGKAMLLFETLELKLGKPAMVAFLRTLDERFRGRGAAWADLVALLGELQGADVAAWMQEWLDRPGAPALELSGRRDGDGWFRGTIAQVPHDGHPAGDAPFRGAVQLGIHLDDVEAPTLHTVELTGRETRVSLPLPQGAVSVQLDPLHRFPRHVQLHKQQLPDRLANTIVPLEQ